MHTKKPWIGVNGKSNKGLCIHSWLSFMDCIKLHKLTVFSADAAEKQRYYMQEMMKKPQQVTVHQFMSRMGVLNDYLAYMPMVYDSSMAVAGTKEMNIPFDEADLAGIMLNLVPSSWVNQYNMTHSMLPKNPRALLNDLEAIKQVVDEKLNANLKAKAKEASSASKATKGSSKKHSASGSPGELQVPKKGEPNKFCRNCNAKGRPHLTHNTKGCRRYNGMGNPASLIQTRPAEAKKPTKKGGNKQMAYLSATIETLVKKGLKKATKGKKVVSRAVPDSWSTSNGIFKTKKMSEVELSFVEYSASKKVYLHPDRVEYPRGGPPPLYSLIIGKQTLHDLGAVLDFKERTITIDEILLPMRNINNLQLKPSISRVLKLKSSFTQEPASTRNATKRVVEILDTKYDKQTFQAL